MTIETATTPTKSTASIVTVFAGSCFITLRFFFRCRSEEEPKFPHFCMASSGHALRHKSKSVEEVLASDQDFSQWVRAVGVSQRWTLQLNGGPQYEDDFSTVVSLAPEQKTMVVQKGTLHLRQPVSILLRPPGNPGGGEWSVFVGNYGSRAVGNRDVIENNGERSLVEGQMVVPGRLELDTRLANLTLTLSLSLNTHTSLFLSLSLEIHILSLCEHPHTLLSTNSPAHPPHTHFHSL